MINNYYMSDKHKEAIKRWTQANPDRVREIARNYSKKQRETDPLYFVKKIFKERKRSAKEKGLPFTITLEDVKNVPAVCPIFGIKLTSGEGFKSASTASLDKIDPKLGYTPENTQWISWRANSIKRDATAEEIYKLNEWFQSRQSTPSLP